MDRNRVLEGSEVEGLYVQLHALQKQLGEAFTEQFDRSLPFADIVFDRWDRARTLGFGVGSSIYDSSFVFGRVEVGEATWVGPYAILDGSGGLRIGAHCTLAAGVQIYTHDNVKQTLSGGSLPIERSPVTIGDSAYIGPNSIVRRGINIGSHCLIGAGSYVSRDVPAFTIVAGTPARPIGCVRIEGGEVTFDYRTDLSAEDGTGAAGGPSALE